MRRNRRGTMKKVDEMITSTRRLPNRRQRSSSTSSPDDNWARSEMEEKDLEFLSPKKRMRSVTSLQACVGRVDGLESTITGRGEGEFEVDLGEVSRDLVVKSSSDIFNSNHNSLSSRASNMKTGVIGAHVPRKARSACVKRSQHENSTSVCHIYQQQSNSGACESGERICCKLSDSFNEDIEMEVAEILFGLTKQSFQPDNAMGSQQKPANEPEQFKGDVEVWLGKNKFEQAEISGASEVKLLENLKVPVGLDNAKTLIEDGGLVKEFKKEKSLSHTGYRWVTESRNSVDMNVIQMAPLAEYQKGKLEIDFMRTLERTKKHIPEVTIGMQENYMTEMGSFKVPLHITSQQLEQLNWNLEATKPAQISSSSLFPVGSDVRPTNCSMRHMEPKETIAFMGKSTGPVAVDQSRKVSQVGRKRCATHYYIALSIARQPNEMNLLSSATGSACSSGNSFFKEDSNERQPQGLSLKYIALKSPSVTNSTRLRDKDAATEISCLLDSTQRKQHMNHKASRLSSSVKNMRQMAGVESGLSGVHASTSRLKTALPIEKLFATGDVTTSSSLSTMDQVMRLYNSDQVTSDGPPFMSIIPNNDYAFPISRNIGDLASFKGSGHGQRTPCYNGALYPPQMFYPQLLSQQPPHPQTLPSDQVNTVSSQASFSDKLPHQKQKHGPNVSDHTFQQPATMHSQYPQKRDFPLLHKSHNPDVEIAHKRPLVDNTYFYGQRSSHGQRSGAPFQQMPFTVTPMGSRKNNASKVKDQDLIESPKGGFELPAPQAVSIPYSSLGGTSIGSGIILPLPAHTSLGKSPAKSYAVPYDQTGMAKGCSDSTSSGKVPSSYTAPKNAGFPSHYGFQQHHAQVIWSNTSTTNCQPLSVLSTYNPVMMPHLAHWSSSVRPHFPQSTSTPPTFGYNPQHQLVSQFCATGGNNNKSVATMGNGVSVTQAQPTLADSLHSLAPKLCGRSANGRKRGSAASPTSDPNGNCSNSSIQQNLSSPAVCRMVVPPILSTCPSQVSELKH